MVTLLLIALDWSPLQVVHAGWLLSVATILLVLLWAGIAVALLATAFVAIALHVDRLELRDGRLRRQLVLQPHMEVRVEGATLKRIAGTTAVRGAAGKGRVLIPHLFYAQPDLDRLWAAAGLVEDAPDRVTPPG